MINMLYSPKQVNVESDVMRKSITGYNLSFAKFKPFESKIFSRNRNSESAVLNLSHSK